MEDNNDTGHWIYAGNFEPTEWFGFVYRIVDLDNNKEYIGKKQFWGKVTKPPLKGKKRRRITYKDSGWRTYTSSSTHINDAIIARGKDRFVFLIESLHETKASLHYAEVLTQINEDVLRAKMPDGTRKYYNGMIGHMKFLPPDETELEAAHKIRSAVTSISKNEDNKFINDEIYNEVIDSYKI